MFKVFYCHSSAQVDFLFVGTQYTYRASRQIRNQLMTAFFTERCSYPVVFPINKSKFSLYACYYDFLCFSYRQKYEYTTYLPLLTLTLISFLWIHPKLMWCVRGSRLTEKNGLQATT